MGKLRLEVPQACSLRKSGSRLLPLDGRVISVSLASYILLLLLGLIPVNNDFEPDPDGIEVRFSSGAIHADIILPIATESIDWREHIPAESFAGDTSQAVLIAIGRGDKEFLIETPTASDWRLLTTLKALFWPSEACLQVSLTTAESLPDSAKTVRLSVAQYEQLVEFINQSFRHDKEGRKLPIPSATAGPNKAFFEAHGTYHGFNTCNCWVGRAMQASGIQTGWFTPLPKTMFLYLPDEE
jgi:uncharacterized protein (TIGR02117 family)